MRRRETAKRARACTCFAPPGTGLHAAKDNAMMIVPKLRGMLLVCCLTLVASGCATAPPLNATGTWIGLKPYQIGNEAKFDEQVVLWGGMIVEVVNRDRSTEITVLAYPLDKRQQPKLESASEGRFVAVLPGFVEPLDYPQGRFVSLRGRMFGTREGTIQGRQYVFPLVQVQAAHVWPRDFRNAGPNFSIGIGISR